MTDKTLKEKFIEILKFNMLEPTIDPEDGNFEDHRSIQLWKLFTNELAKARSEKTTHYPNGSTIKFSYTTIPNTYKWIDRTKEQVSVKNVYLNKEGNLVKIKKE